MWKPEERRDKKKGTVKVALLIHSGKFRDRTSFNVVYDRFLPQPHSSLIINNQQFDVVRSELRNSLCR